MAQQLILDLPLRPALGRDDFLVAPSNAAAVAMIDQWPRWPSYGAILLGGDGSGKSHLAHVWQQKCGALWVEASDLTREALPALMIHNALVIENLHRGKSDEQALFHVLNMARDRGGFLLVTTVAPIGALGLSLPDLKSRLGALPSAEILPPDDALLRGMLVKQFGERQISVDETLVTYLMSRMPRSPAMVRQLVAAIDREALAQRAEVNRVFAGKVLARLLQPELGQN